MSILARMKIPSGTVATALYLAEFCLVFLHQPLFVLLELLHPLRQRIHLWPISTT